MTKVDLEIAAMSAIATALDGLADEEARMRVLDWASTRFGATQPVKRKAAAAKETPEGEFEHVGDVAEAIGATTEDDYALAAAFLLQESRGETTLVAQALNDELKNAGHGVSNISRTLGNLIKLKPALMRQLSKSGNSKQARKTYKMTTAGVAEVRRRMTPSPEAGN